MTQLIFNNSLLFNLKVTHIALPSGVVFISMFAIVAKISLVLRNFFRSVVMLHLSNVMMFLIRLDLLHSDGQAPYYIRGPCPSATIRVNGHSDSDTRTGLSECLAKKPFLLLYLTSRFSAGFITGTLSAITYHYFIRFDIAAFE